METDRFLGLDNDFGPRYLIATTSPNFSERSTVISSASPEQGRNGNALAEETSDFEQVVSYTLLNTLITISMTLVLILEYDSQHCSKEVYTWFFLSLFVLTVDTSLKCLQLRNREQSWLTMYLSDIILLVWIIYGNVIFITEPKECLGNSPLMIYTLLFIFVMGFIYLVKVTFYLLVLLIWLLSNLFCNHHVSFRDIMHPDPNPSLRQALFEKGHGLTYKQIEALPEMKYLRFRDK